MKIKSIIRTVFAILFWVAIWFILAKKVDLEVLLPSPQSTLYSLANLAKTKKFWIISLYSVYRITSGLLIGALAALLLASITAFSKFAYSLLSPLLTVIKATPIASFIILALLWIGRDSVPAFITFLIVLPIVWSAVYDSIVNIDKRYVEVGTVFKFTKLQKIRHIYGPSIFSSFMASLGTSAGMAWKAGVAAEVLCTPKYSIGTELFESKKYIETSDLFAWTLVVIILSVIITKILVYLCNLAAERSGGVITKKSDS